MTRGDSRNANVCVSSRLLLLYSNVCLLSACQVIFSIVSCHHFGYDGKLLLLYYRGLSKGRGVRSR